MTKDRSSGGEDEMYDFIFNVPASHGPSIGGLPINSPLAGSFLGVFLAFMLNYGYQFCKNYWDKINYKKNIKWEINLCVDRLERAGDLLPTDRWTSVLNSGALRLFGVDEVDKLSRAYEGIQNYNYEAKRTRDAGEDHRKTPSYIHLEERWEEYSTRLNGIRDQLLSELQKLLGEYLNPLIIKADEAGAYYEYPSEERAGGSSGDEDR